MSGEYTATVRGQHDPKDAADAWPYVYVSVIALVGALLVGKR